MLCLWLFAGLLHGCMGGLYPASAESSVEAHGPLARLALDHGVTHVTSLHHVPTVAQAPITAYAAQTAHVAPVYQVPTVAQTAHVAPVYQVPTVAQTAHVAPVYQVPTVAHVPVLKYSSQPQYTQRLVDVANPKLAVAKLQVRRPAIQKQFYDIEERTIVRPVGSAVLELEEPVSRQLLSPFSVVPPRHHTIAQYHRPLLYPVGAYPLVSYNPLQYPVQYYPPASIQQTPQPPQYYPINSQPTQQFPLNPQPPQQTPSTSYPPQLMPTNPQFPQQPSNSDSKPPQQMPTNPQFPQQPSNTDSQPPQQFQFVSQPPNDNSFSPEFDSSDSVVIDNPDFTRTVKSNEESEKGNENEDDSFDDLEREISEYQNENYLKDREVQNIINDFENLQLLRMFSRQNDNEKTPQRSQQHPNFQVLLEPPKILEQLQQTQKNPTGETQSLQRSTETASGERNLLTQTEDSIETSSARSSHQHSSSTTERELPSLYRSYLNHLREDQNTAAKPYSTGKVISSVRNLSPEESQNNQRKLLELLTGGGGVSEVAVTRSGESAVRVRGRVLSVTPAPCTEGEERVNTRRVVVSRPGHTVEEVDVHRPFTQLERVAVHEPVHTHIATLAPVLYH